MELSIFSNIKKGIIGFFVERYLKKEFDVYSNFNLNDLSVTTDKTGTSHARVGFSADIMLDSLIMNYLKKKYKVNTSLSIKKLSVSTDTRGISHVNVDFNARMKDTELDKLVSKMKEGS